MDQPIAILDSGVGGLTVAKEMMRQLPQEQIVYFGDTARTPYGPRPAKEIVRFTQEIVDYLLQFQPKMIVIACNTATAAAWDQVRMSLDIPVVGVIQPGARAAIKTTRRNTVGVIGTEGTIRSRAYEHALRKIAPQLQIVGIACPEFVPLVEKGRFRGEEAQHVVERSLAELKSAGLDCLILGCTHYPFLADIIASVMGPDVALISSAEETAREISTILYHKGMQAKSTFAPVHRFFCSGDPLLFRAIAETWLNEPVQVTPVVWEVPNIY
ncbi:glutamate racemase [Paenibacillus ginsengihumi]|uniref:glutamate racemase n=1 Tax=Paenibacillus ginsengihumi TaxID=431596 RepID=UPI000364E607|nr:glutamate racemase [Paenibacillus ginsengihumi]